MSGPAPVRAQPPFVPPVDASGSSWGSLIPGDDESVARYEVARHSPLVVLGVVETAWSAERLADRLASNHPESHFVGVVCADEGDDVGALLAGLAPVLEEVVFTACSSPRALPGAALAWEALERFGMGQDFVYTVPRLPDAIRYALAALGDRRRRGWEGNALLVPGSPTAVDEARELFLGDH